MTKIPQQIKDEVEKEIKEAEDKIHENAKDDKHYSAWVHSDMIKIISEGKVKLSILTEYDKSIKEMIEDEFEKLRQSLWLVNSANDRTLELIYPDINEWIPKKIDKIKQELLSKIGDNSNNSQQTEDCSKGGSLRPVPATRIIGVSADAPNQKGLCRCGHPYDLHSQNIDRCLTHYCRCKKYEELGGKE